MDCFTTKIVFPDTFFKKSNLKKTHDIITAGLTLPFPQVVSSCLSSTLSTTQRRWNSWNRVSSNCRGLDQRSCTPPFVKQQSSLIQGTGTLPIFLSYNMFFDILYINLRIVHCTVLLKYHSSCKHLILSSTKKTCCVTVGFVNLSILASGWLKLLEYIRRKLFGEPLPRKASQRLSIEDFGHYIQYLLIHVIRDSFNFRS